MLLNLFWRYFGMFKMLLVLLVLETPLTHRDGFFVIYMSSGAEYTVCKISLSFPMVSTFKCCGI